MKFPYVLEGEFERPLVPVWLRHGIVAIPYQALLDTGADHSVAHIELAAELGLTIPRRGLVEVVGVTGSASGFIAKLDLEIAGTRFTDVPVIFADLGPRSFGILGHAGLFDRLRLVFEFGQREFEITPKQYQKR